MCPTGLPLGDNIPTKFKILYLKFMKAKRTVKIIVLERKAL